MTRYGANDVVNGIFILLVIVVKRWMLLSPYALVVFDFKVDPKTKV